MNNRGTSLHHLMRRTATDKANKVQKWRTQKFHLENSVQGEQLKTWRTVRLQSHSACPTSLMIGEPQRLRSKELNYPAAQHGEQRPSDNHSTSDSASLAYIYRWGKPQLTRRTMSKSGAQLLTWRTVRFQSNSAYCLRQCPRRAIHDLENIYTKTPPIVQCLAYIY